jgi:diguanylate cyclase (GGDEF)-like protein/PAS domain S-box-containing protein
LKRTQSYTQRPTLFRFSLGVLIFVAALALRFQLLPVDLGYPFLTFYPALVLCFYLCGLGPGILFVALSAITALTLFKTPDWQLASASTGNIAVVVYLLSAGLIGLVVNQLRTYATYVNTLFESAPGGMLAIDVGSGKIIKANLAAERLWGYSLEELQTRSLDDLTYPDDLARIQQAYLQVKMGSADQLLFKARCVRKGGSVFWSETNVTSLKNADGTIKYVFGNSIEITGRLETESKLAELNRDFVTFLEHTSDFVYFKDADNRFRFCSQSLAKIAGHNSWRDMVGKRLFELFPEEMAKVYCQEELSVFRDGVPLLDKQDPYLDETGKKGWVSTSKWPQFDNQGNVQGIIGISRDITVQKCAVEQLKASEARYRSLLEDQTEIICRFKADGTMVYANDAFCRIFGMTREGIVGQSWHPVAWPEDLAMVKQQLAILSPENPVVVVENRILADDGSLRWGQFVNRAFFGQDGLISEIQTVGHDITELKKVQGQLHSLIAEQKAMLNSDLVGIVKLRNRQAVWVNTGMERIFGYQPGEMNGQSTRILYPDEASYQALGEKAYPTLKTQGIYRDQVQLVRKDGQKIWVDVSGVMLLDSLVESLWMMLDVTGLKEQQHALENIAYHDILTGLPNRLLVADRLGQLMVQANREKQLIAVCYLDLDGFKPVNDQFGHNAGDMILKEIARRIEALVHATDTVGRLGGDEFILLLTNLEGAEEYPLIMQRVIESINAPLAINESCQVNVGVSIGVALFPKDADDVDTLLSRADQAMYKAKGSGRNRVCLFNGESRRG